MVACDHTRSDSALQLCSDVSELLKAVDYVDLYPLVYVLRPLIRRKGPAGLMMLCPSPRYSSSSVIPVPLCRKRISRCRNDWLIWNWVWGSFSVLPLTRFHTGRVFGKRSTDWNGIPIWSPMLCTLLAAALRERPVGDGRVRCV